jgi:hypothetical protein
MNSSLKTKFKNENETLPFPHEETEFSLDFDNNKINLSGDSESSNKLSTSSISEPTNSMKPKASTSSRNSANQSSSKSSTKKK